MQTSSVPDGKLARENSAVPLYDVQLVTSSRNTTISRPTTSVWTRCNCVAFAETTFSSKLFKSSFVKMSGQTEKHITVEYDSRPWGSYTVLDDRENYKAKRIEVLPGKRLSYQRHERRAEHWFVTQGTAKVTLNGREILVTAGSAVDIAVGDAHRVENPSESELLVFIEVQTGDYFGEDDIERLEDDFGRQ